MLRGNIVSLQTHNARRAPAMRQERKVEDGNFNDYGSCQGRSESFHNSFSTVISSVVKTHSTAEIASREHAERGQGTE